MTIQQLLFYAKQQLVSVTDNPTLEAEILLAHALQKPRSYLYTRTTQIISDAEIQQFTHYLERRFLHEPIAYLTGLREFWSLELQVNQATLIPRSETELLVEKVLELFPAQDEKINMADLGTGSGAIALALGSERPMWRIDATDISDGALIIAKNNANRLDIRNVSFLKGDWCAALSANYYDVIVSNPPYIAETEWPMYEKELAFEPRDALTSGVDGLDAIRKIGFEAKRHLISGGYLLIEHGFSQAKAVREILESVGYTEITSFCDLSGHERVTTGRYFFSLLV